MKKLIVIALALVFAISLVSCSLLPESLQSTLEDLKNNLTGNSQNDQNNQNGEGDNQQPPEEEPVHVHEFIVVDFKDPNCTKGGYQKFECACGEKKENELEPLGHDMVEKSRTEARCAQFGSISYQCSVCKKKETKTLKPIGHDWAEVVEPSRLITCHREGCNGGKLCDCNGKYTEDLKFTFGDAEKAEIEAKHNKLVEILSNAEKYDATLHAYAETGALAEEYEAVEKIYEEYSDLIYAAQGQYSIAMTLYYCDDKNEDLKKIYNDMMEYYNSLVSNYYSLSQPWYDSKYREYAFYGATEEEINAFLFDSNAYANPEYTALKDRNDAIELEFNNIPIPNRASSPLVPELYAEFVENNNKMAKILGYNNYLEYAYENIYDRDYTYEDVAQFVQYVKKYITPAFNGIYGKWEGISGYTDADIEEYYSVVQYSFFENVKSNKLFNDYIDDMNMAFTSNPDKQISFSDHLNNLMSDGNLFRGTYKAAYVTYISGKNIPIAYFGNGYDNSSTIAHEFGHYMNEVYNESEYNQSFDLLETHSQGDELLYLYYLNGKISDKAYELVETYQILNMFYITMAAVQVDCFEQAIYLNSYEGHNSDIIMADGKITADEYDLLYESLSVELGIKEDYRNNTYWRNGMTISSPCYYVSYSVAAINALQIYAKAYNESFDAAKDSYLKLFTYTDENPDMTVEEVLLYADLISYNAEELYRYIGSFYLSH